MRLPVHPSHNRSSERTNYCSYYTLSPCVHAMQITHVCGELVDVFVTTSVLYANLHCFAIRQGFILPLERHTVTAFQRAVRSLSLKRFHRNETPSRLSSERPFKWKYWRVQRSYLSKFNSEINLSVEGSSLLGCTAHNTAVWRTSRFF